MNILVEAEKNSNSIRGCFIVCGEATCGAACPKLECGVDKTK